MAAALLVLAGCSSDTDQGTDETPDQTPVSLEERVTFEEVALPQELVSTSRGAGSWSAVAEAGDLPRLAVTRVFHGTGGAGKVGVWHATGTGTLSEQGEIEVGGNVRSTNVASDGTLTAIAGQTVLDGKPGGYLLTSTDRTTWEQVELPADVTAVNAHDLAVAGGRVYLLGSGATGRVPQLAVYDTADGSSSVTALRAPAEDENVSLRGVAVSGERVVVIAESGPSGQDVEPAAHVSTDGGATFTSEGMGGAAFTISGVVAGAGEFIAVGSVRTAGFGKPAAWSSADGLTWRVDDLSLLWDWDPRGWSGKQADVSFSSPIFDPGSGTVMATMRPDGAEAPAAVIRDSEGVWEARAYSGIPGWTSDGVITPAGGGGLSVLATVNDGSAKEQLWPNGREGSTDGVEDVELLDHTIGPAGFAATYIGDRIAMSSMTRTFTDLGDTFRKSATAETYSYTPEAGVVADQWAPPGLDLAATNPVMGYDAENEDALLAAVQVEEDDIVVRTWLRQDGAWIEGAAFNDEPYQNPHGVERTSSGWFASLQVADGAHMEFPRTAQVQASTDGLRWSAQEVEHPFEDGRASSIGSFCETPAGILAAGSAEDSDGRSSAVVWRQSGDTWEASIIPGTGDGQASSCVSTEDGVVVFGFVGLQSVHWTSTDGKTFQEADRLEGGHVRGFVREVSGGYVANGYFTTDAYAGPVLWLSRDAETWEWVPVPTDSGDISHADVVPAGDDLMVLHNSPLSAWRVPDIASVFTG